MLWRAEIRTATSKRRAKVHAYADGGFGVKVLVHCAVSDSFGSCH